MPDEEKSTKVVNLSPKKVASLARSLPDVDSLLDDKFMFSSNPQPKPLVKAEPPEPEPEVSVSNGEPEPAIEKQEIRDTIDKYLREKGLKEFVLVNFKLPTEYRGSTAIFKQEKKNGKTINSEVRTFDRDPTEYRTLRFQFYSQLHKIAYNTQMGWVLIKGKDAKVLDSIITDLNRLNNDMRTVYVQSAFISEEFVINQLGNYIQELKSAVELRLEKVADAVRDKQDVDREVRELRGRIIALENELTELNKDKASYFKR